MKALRSGLVLAPLMLGAICLLTVSISEAADDWTGRWRGTVAVTAGEGTGRTLPCELLISRTGVGFGGTVTCPGFGPVPLSATGRGGMGGIAAGGISFTGTRQGGTITGTWTHRVRGSSGTWSITRAGAP